MVISSFSFLILFGIVLRVIFNISRSPNPTDLYYLAKLSRTLLWVKMRSTHWGNGGYLR